MLLGGNDSRRSNDQIKEAIKHKNKSQDLWIMLFKKMFIIMVGCQTNFIVIC